jgi:UDP-N-acetylglucosamine 1-carboxyvinyltransferase
MVSSLTSPKLAIQGGTPLEGRVRTSGSKNGADYALAACLLTAEECVLENVPEIDDVRLMAGILSALGAEVKNEGDGVWRIHADPIQRFDAPNELVVNQRASFLVMGPLLGRFGQAACCSPGGDVLGTRPLDVHLAGFKALGAKVSRDGEQYLAELNDRPRLKAGRLFLDYPSVTGTMNLIFAATLAQGTTTIVNAAAEPEIASVVEMLQAMGAKIEGGGTSVVQVEGVPELHGVRHRVIPDRLEAGFFALAGAATRGDVVVEDCAPEHLDALLYKMREAGVQVDAQESRLHVRGDGCEFRSIQAQAVPYPGLASDLQPTLAAFLTQCQGVSVIQERVYENRLLYIGELRKMGADVIMAGQTAIITGATQLYGTLVRALDVRAGGSLVLAALTAEGRTEINDIYHIDRAYDDLAGKLRGLGATVERL